MPDDHSDPGGATASAPALAVAALIATILPPALSASDGDALRPPDAAGALGGPGSGATGGPLVHPTGRTRSSDTLESLVADATRGVVLIDVETPDGSRQGSGFIVDSDGLIVTNQHVMENAVAARVQLASGDVYRKVSVLAMDERRDLAVVQVSAFDLPTLELGNSDSVKIGADVIAIGSPLGLENTVSTGIVSGRRKEPDGYHLLQISAPASQGSSGGPVLSPDGRAIGVATSQMQGGQNLNFAVPINYARGLLNHLDRSEPLTVLAPGSGSSQSEKSARLTSEEAPVNRGLTFDLDEFGGYELEFEGRSGESRWRQTRVTYRRINSLSGDEPRIERYYESETTERTGPFRTNKIVRRRRSRVIVDARSLRPISARGEVAWGEAGDWHSTEYDLRFDGGSVRGTVEDSTGSVHQVDRELPPDIIPRSMRNLAFATLAADSLVGRSVELVTFEPQTARVVSDRYDVRDTTTVTVRDETYRALRVTVASGLSNSTAYFRLERPRFLLRKTAPPADRELELVEVTTFPTPQSSGSSPRP